MASLLETWRRWITIPERAEQSIRSDRRMTAAERESHIQRRKSAERAVERLAEKKGTPHSEVQNSVYSEVSVPEQGKRFGDIKEDVKNLELQKSTTEEIPIFTSEEIKRIVEEALQRAKDTEEIKEYLAQRFSVIEGQILSVRNVQKQEMIAVSVREVQEKVDLIRLDTRKIGSIKVILGFSICFNLITLAVLVAYVLNYI